jgi:sec-independent protein translocase protein TatA
MGQIGVWQVILVLLIVLIIFGAGKLPRVMGDVAKGVKNFKRGMRDDDSGEADGTSPRQIDADQEPPANADAGRDTKAHDRTGTG